jgi:hypothetical protein
MAQGKKINNTIPIGSIESAVISGDFCSARLSMAARLARMLDNTDSARDVKALSMSLIPLLDRCELDEQARSTSEETPLADILAEAEAALANA